MKAGGATWECQPPATEVRGVIWGFPKIRVTLLGGPNDKDSSILGSILGSPYFGKSPYIGDYIGDCHRGYIVDYIRRLR